MKKCKTPQCLTEISENAPDFCPAHAVHAKRVSTLKEISQQELEEFEKEFAMENDRLISLAAKRYDSIAPQAFRSEIKRWLLAHDKRVVEAAFAAVKVEKKEPLPSGDYDSDISEQYEKNGFNAALIEKVEKEKEFLKE